jgi:hypothetical protein
MSLSERWTAVNGLRKHWTTVPGVQRVRVGYERYGMQSDLEYFEERMRAQNESYEIQELSWTKDGAQSKVDRVQRLQPDFKAGKFFLASIEENETSNQRRMRESGQSHRIFAPIRRRDHNGEMYSLNKGFLDEYLTFPFSAKKDLIDAASRLYDMSPLPPIIVDMRALEPEVFVDGV